MRYEKSLDPEMTTVAIARFVKLLKDIDANAEVVSALTDEKAFEYPKVKLDFNKAFVDRYTGIEIDNETIVNTLTSLGFGVELKDNEFSVDVPSWRATKDVTIKADIIEEITRIYGYDNFEIFTAASPILPVRKEIIKSDEDRMKDILVKSYRLHEVHSYIWSDAKKNAELGIETPDNVTVINAQTPDHAHLRVSMIPTLLAFAKENRGYADSFGIFEIGHTVDGLREDGTCNEQNKLGVVLYSKSCGEEALFGRAVDMARELVADILHKDAQFESIEAPFDFAHPVNSFAIIVEGKKVGYVGVPHPTVLENVDKKCAVAFFEIVTADFASVKADTTKYKEPSKFPAIEIDMTFNADISAVDFVALCASAKSVAGESLSGVRVHDIYTADGVSALTLRFAFVSEERTLSKQELTPAIDAIVAELSKMGLSIKA